MRTSSITFDRVMKDANGVDSDAAVFLEWDWKGASICGRGPDDDSPEIQEVWGYVTFTDDNGVESVRDLTKEEANAISCDSKIEQYMAEKMHEDYNDGGPDDAPYDY